MAFSIQLISHPSPGVFEFIRQRAGAVGKKLLSEVEIHPTAVGLVQGKVVDMIAAADVAEGIFGDIADVKASIQAIEEAEHLK
jgi:hypothetical protein